MPIGELVAIHSKKPAMLTAVIERGWFRDGRAADEGNALSPVANRFNVPEINAIALLQYALAELVPSGPARALAGIAGESRLHERRSEASTW